MGNEVGYKKPPADKQFKKGKSGNPKGRPKKDESAAGLIRKALYRKVPITEDGLNRKVKFMEAMILNLQVKALNGDLGAIKILLSLSEKKEFREPEESRIVFYLPDNGRGKPVESD